MRNFLPHSETAAKNCIQWHGGKKLNVEMFISVQIRPDIELAWYIRWLAWYHMSGFS